MSNWNADHEIGATVYGEVFGIGTVIARRAGFPSIEVRVEWQDGRTYWVGAEQVEAVTVATFRSYVGEKTFALADGSTKTARLTREVYDLRDGRTVSIKSHENYDGVSGRYRPSSYSVVEVR